MVNIASGEPRTPGHHFISSAPFIRCSHPIIFRTPVIEEAIKQSQQIWFEIDPKDESFGEKLREAAKLPKGQLVQSKIHPKTYEYLRKITLSGMNDWHHLPPWAIAMILRNPTLGNPDYRWGMDSYIAQRARYYGKPADGLETVDEHIRVFSDMFDAEGEVVLLQAIIHAKGQAGQFRQDVAAWKAGDTARLYAIHTGEMKEAPTVWWRLLDRRNARWIPRIETAIRSGRPTLIVAGALAFRLRRTSTLESSKIRENWWAYGVNV